MEGYKTLIKQQSIGKGMTMSLKIIKDEAGEHIRMNNSYFGGNIFQSYSKDTDTTTIQAQLYMMYSPKWLLEKLGGIATNNPSHVIIDDGTIRISFTGYGGELTSKVTKKGIALQGNIDNISALRVYRHQLNTARDIIKNNSYDDIVNCATGTEVSDVGPFSPTNSYQYDLNPDKFFKLHGSKD